MVQFMVKGLSFGGNHIYRIRYLTFTSILAIKLRRYHITITYFSSKTPQSHLLWLVFTYLHVITSIAYLIMSCLISHHRLNLEVTLSAPFQASIFQICFVIPFKLQKLNLEGALVIVTCKDRTFGWQTQSCLLRPVLP